jgi:hypothetical protein
MQLNKTLLAFAAAITASITLGIASPARAQWTLGQWNLGANGHYYSVQQITGGTYGWSVARSQAQSLISPNGTPVDLATSTSATENAFIFAGIDSPTYWVFGGNSEGPILGGYQLDKLAEPAGDWGWVTGETWSFNAWNSGEPNNFANAEDYVSFFTFGSGRSSGWNDTSTLINGVGGADLQYYVAETTAISASAPEPGTLALLALGGTLVIVQRRRHRYSRS